VTETWTRVCHADDVPLNAPLAVVLDQDKVCVVRTADGIRCLLDRCPHRDIALSGGLLKDGLLTCPGHFWRFDLTDGHRTDDPSDAATLYPTRVTGEGWVEAVLPEPEAPMSMREWLLAQARASQEAELHPDQPSRAGVNDR